MLESWSSTASSAYGVDWGVKSTPLQSNKITDSVCHLSGIYSEALELLAILHKFYRSTASQSCYFQ